MLRWEVAQVSSLTWEPPSSSGAESLGPSSLAHTPGLGTAPRQVKDTRLCHRLLLALASCLPSLGTGVLRWLDTGLACSPSPVPVLSSSGPESSVRLPKQPCGLSPVCAPPRARLARKVPHTQLLWFVQLQSPLPIPSCLWLTVLPAVGRSSQLGTRPAEWPRGLFEVRVPGSCPEGKHRRGLRAAQWTGREPSSLDL